MFVNAYYNYKNEQTCVVVPVHVISRSSQIKPVENTA